MASTRRATLALACVVASLELATAFCPSALSPTSLGLRSAARSLSTSSLVGLRCSGNDDQPKYVKLEKTQTSWQGWGTSTQKREDQKIEVDASNPTVAVQKALDAARESENIAKYLGTTDSKKRAGITGDVELVSYADGRLILRLTGNFWHNRQMVFSETGDFIKKMLPDGMIQTIDIEDPQQLNGFAETSRHFESQETITEDDLRKKEAKGVNIYGETLENPFAKFRRKKLEDQAKYEEEMKRRRELDGADEATQLQAVLEDTKAGKVFSGEGAEKQISEDDLRPEDILNAMLKQ